jgi:choline dehydrogenase-like flavoprotein
MPPSQAELVDTKPGAVSMDDRACADRGGLDVIVVGGGIGGAAAAVSVRLAGHRVTVLEQARYLAPVGAGIQLAPNATRILAQFGVAEALSEHALVPQRHVRRHWRDGAVLGERSLGDAVAARYGAPFWHVHRADLHAALMSAARRPCWAGMPGRVSVWRGGHRPARQRKYGGRGDEPGWPVPR